MRASFLLLIYTPVVILVADARIRTNVEKKLAAIIEGQRGKRA